MPFSSPVSRLLTCLLSLVTFQLPVQAAIFAPEGGLPPVTFTRLTDPVLAAADPHVADFREFGAPDCEHANQGVWTALTSDVGTCYNFTDVVCAVNVTDVNGGCAVHVWSGQGCTGSTSRALTADGTCGSVNYGVQSWNSFVLLC